MKIKNQLMAYTIGHSAQSLERFIRTLQVYKITELVDIRTIPRSSHNPQFNIETLPGGLETCKIGYNHMKGLGGLRRPFKNSPNNGWRNASFRGFADHMQTAEFSESLEELLEVSRQAQVALMCAEAVPWRCHRSLIADALLIRGVQVKHILSESEVRLHKLTAWARVEDTRITYPAASLPSPEA